MRHDDAIELYRLLFRIVYKMSSQNTYRESSRGPVALVNGKGRPHTPKVSKNRHMCRAKPVVRRDELAPVVSGGNYCKKWMCTETHPAVITAGSSELSEQQTSAHLNATALIHRRSYRQVRLLQFRLSWRWTPHLAIDITRPVYRDYTTPFLKDRQSNDSNRARFSGFGGARRPRQHNANIAHSVTKVNSGIESSFDVAAYSHITRRTV
ncbi:hypothetical protein EVAR_16927_1 [Eumeta japonica]|uniref:Uncharacterized protein n=1 Tax=Eumeta variegata TaxID=151549 RepID=A0A4C1TVB6_EUMVA|nr:hypothetical protein EVAR_16927_1 [Eumeta japonica]